MTIFARCPGWLRALALLTCACQWMMAQEPALPAGLGGAPGTDAKARVTTQEPTLPLGLPGSASEASKAEAESGERAAWRLPDEISGFWEMRWGARLQRDPYQRRASIGETRLQTQFDKAGERAGIKVVADLLYDPVLGHHSVELYRGDGFLDLRQANLFLRPTDFLDLTLGRQIITWGTGDMLFINDLFPKDWNSYFCGRDDEYLKAPSDALKAAFFTPLFNFDLIYMPRFNSDRYIDGRRISYWNSALGRRAGRDATIDVERPDDYFRDDEWAGRLYRMVGTYEVALYGYEGFWKSPGGMNPENGRATFPRLRSYGASARGPLGPGIFNMESGFYHSRDDNSGSNPFVNNSEMRYLIGYEQELAHELTGGIQYYVEEMLDHGAYRRTLPQGMQRRDEFRQVITLRLTKLLMSQNLSLGAFLYFSPSDRDSFLRPRMSYKLDDHWIVELGGNLFVGRDDHTFFGQFERNNSVYASLRYGF